MILVERGICKICETFFIMTQKGQEMCNSCYEQDVNQYRAVRDYLSENSHATIMDIYFNTKIPMKTLKRYIEEGRIRIIGK